MKQLLCMVLLSCLSFSIYGTAQIPDIIKYKNGKVFAGWVADSRFLFLIGKLY
jgi:hypothetical protein